MGKWHYYNEFDPFAAEWLRNLIRKGLIPDGEVDTRSIIDVRPDDVREFVQCHYFAGIAGWPLALKFAGWPEDRPVWTGSAPCQPWSVAGKGKGTDDERHLWPAFFHLIRECRPPIVFGEQVASKAGREWLAGVFADLEGVGYAGAGADLCAPGVGAPHIRQRLYWVATDMAHANMREPKQFEGDRARPGEAVGGRSCAQSTGRGELVSGPRGDMANAERDGAGYFSGEIADEGRQPMDAGTESLRRGDGAGLSGWPDARNQSDMADTDSELRDGCGNIGPRGRYEHPDRSRSGDVADAESIGRRGRAHDEDEGRREQPSADPCKGSSDMVDAASLRRREGWPEHELRGRGPAVTGAGSSDMADADDERPQGFRANDYQAGRERPNIPEAGLCNGAGFWDDAEWRRGADGKERRTKPGILLLVNGISGGVALERTLPGGEKEEHIYSRVGALRGFGNAIVPQLAAEFIKVFISRSD